MGCNYAMTDLQLSTQITWDHAHPQMW